MYFQDRLARQEPMLGLIQFNKGDYIFCSVRRDVLMKRKVSLQTHHSSLLSSNINAVDVNGAKELNMFEHFHFYQRIVVSMKH